MHPTGRVRYTLLVVLLVSLASAPPAATATGGAGDRTAAGPSHPVASTPTNDTTRHEDPREVRTRGDLEDVRRWLSGRMAVAVERCLVEAGGDAPEACEYGQSYATWNRKYVAVVSEREDAAPGTFSRAKNASEAYSRAVSAFEAAYRDYRQARATGSEVSANRIARDVLRHGEAVNRTSLALVAVLAGLESESELTLTAAADSVNRTRANVTAAVDAVEADLHRTELDAALSPRTISFRAPGTVTARLTAANGSPLADRPVTVTIADHRYDGRTDETGTVSVPYRPTTVPRSRERLVVTYRPKPESPYLGTSDTVPVTIQQIEPTMTVTVGPSSARYGAAISLSGRVAADGIAAADVPVALALDGRRLGTVRTDGAGRFSRPIDVRATDGPGTVQVTARVALEDRALAATSTATRLTIERTGTTLTLNASPDGSTVVVAGRLTTTGGDPVAGRSVQLRVDGTTARAVETGPNGRYRARLATPADSPTADGAVAVVAAFDGAGTNLGSSTARDGVALPRPTADPATAPIERVASAVPGTEWSRTVAVTTAVLVGLGLLLVGWRRRPFGGPADGGVDPTRATDATRESREIPEAEWRSVETAREALDADPDRAVTVAYDLVRDGLRRRYRLASGPTLTHREFLAACRDDGVDEAALEGVSELTQLYETAAYTPAAVPRTDAETAVSLARRLV